MTEITNTTQGMYYEFHIPLGVHQLVEELIAHQPSGRNNPRYVTGSATNRDWFSNPRPGNDDTTEVVTVHFKLPLSVSELGFETLRVPCKIEAWYMDRQNNWRQMLDRQRVPVSINIQATNSASWYTFHTHVYPIVAQAVQIRITRVYDPQLGSSPYVVGLKNTLIRRNVYDRAHGKLPFEEEQDALGNVVSKYIKDWDAPKSIDNQPYTFWKSAPQPDPMAVCNLYLDTRAPDGSAAAIDKLYMDPVYSGQILNVYYSNDDYHSTPKLSAITVLPDTDVDTQWRSGVGRWDTSSTPGTCVYSFPGKWGPMVNQPLWIGMEWATDFEAGDGPAANPVLFKTTPTAADDSQWWPIITYDVGAGEIVLTFTNNAAGTETFNVALSPVLTPGDPLRIVVGWKYDPDTVYISVKNKNGTELALLEETTSSLPSLITLDGYTSFEDFRGTFRAHIIKITEYDNGADDFQANPTMYVAPDPVIPNEDGSIPTTSLDYAIYGVDWTLQEHGTGGLSDTLYTNKTWTPVWRNYITNKGKLYLPASIPMKYMKLEFSNLTEEQYPVYNSGIEVKYKTWPIKVQQLAQQRHLGLLGNIGGLLQLGAQSLLGGLFGGVNWLNPQTVANAVNTIFGPVVQPVTFNVGTASITSSLPGDSATAINNEARTEVSSPHVYRRGPLDPEIMASTHIYMSGNTNWWQTLLFQNNLINQSFADSFTPITKNNTAPLLHPVQGVDWWVFPGRTLRMPTSVMDGLTSLTQVVLGRAPSTEVRTRFVTESVHRYDIKTVTRDAAIAYFAGVREVEALSTTHIDNEDPSLFDFTHYDSDQWVTSNTRSLDSGPVTTLGKVYSIINGDFDYGIGEWDVVNGTWVWDGDQFSGHYYPGIVTATADGTQVALRSSEITAPGNLADIEEGDAIDISCWVKWDSLIVTDDDDGPRLGVISYLDDVEVDGDILLDSISFADWSSNEDSDYVQMSGTWNVPAGVDNARIKLSVGADASSGTVTFDTVTLVSANDIAADITKELITTSEFAKVQCEFSDSGVVRSDNMWARANPLTDSGDATDLAYYTTTIPDPGLDLNTSWSDSFATWGATDAEWGSPYALVGIDVDPYRIFEGQRVLHFRRDSGAGNAGIKVRQWTNFVSGGLFRICARWLKPKANNNTITLRLRRVSTGVYIYEETIEHPPVGYWYEFETKFQEIPDNEDQVYVVEFTTTGDAEDEIYLSDLWVEVSHIRYFMQLGGAAAPLHDVTGLRHADTAIVTSTTPVNEIDIKATILSPKAYIYSCKVQPVYLQ